MNLYCYNEQGIFTHVEQAEIDVLESMNNDALVYLMPPYATELEPEFKEGFAAVWNGEAWELIEDHRGVDYWLPGDKYGSAPREMKELGALPEGATLTEPEQTLDELKEVKLVNLSGAFQNFYEDEATLFSSLDFEADSDSRAKQDVDGLIEVIEATSGESVMFRGADNKLYELTLPQLKVLRLEIIQNGQNAYATKWTYEQAINEAKTKEELESLKIEFKGLDFRVN